MRRLVQDGSLQPGDQLPTVRILASQLKVNFNTIARAYRILDQEGLISTQQGRGTFVLEPVPLTAETPVLPKEEIANQLVSELLSKAGHQNISADELFQAFVRQINIQKRKKKAGHRRMIRTSPKKRIYIPVEDRGWATTNTSPGLRKSRKTRINILTPVTVSRETDRAPEMNQ